MFKSLVRAFAPRRDDEGIGLILVIGTASVVTAMMIVLTTMASRSLTSSRQHVSFEGAIALAEDGIDQMLARAQKTYQTVGTDSYAFPSSTSTCGGYSTINWTSSVAPDGTPAPGSFADESEGLTYERKWAESWLETLGASCAVSTSSTSSTGASTPGEGDYVYFKPVGHQTVYGMGWAPGYGRSDAKMRFVKSEYLFTPYAPTNAILTAGDLELDSSTTVKSAPPNDNSLASVHANGSISVPNGNPIVYGTVSQSGSGNPPSSDKFYANTGGAVTVNATQSIPYVSAVAVWGTEHATNPTGGWYDLCPDGTVHNPDGTSPCAGSVLASATTVASSGFRGWTYSVVGSVPRWTATSALKTNGYSGTYYISGGDAVASASNAGSAVPNLTIIAAAQSLTCNKVGGNIDWDHIDLAAPSVPSMFMLADQDLRTSSNITAGSDVNGTVVSGLFIAGDQIQMETSSTGAYGAVVAADECDPANGTTLVDSNIVKNPSIYYDPNASTPFVDIINTTLWLEYTH